MIRLIYIWRKFARELKQRYPEIAGQRKKHMFWPYQLCPFPTYAIPNENDMIDEELIALKRKALFTFIMVFIPMILSTIITFLLRLIFG